MPVISQLGVSSEWYKEIRELANGTYELKAYSKDSIHLFKGTLRTLDPEIREGKFYFLDSKGRLKAAGQYRDDFPFGVWTSFDSLMQIKGAVDYGYVWDYFESGENAFSVDSLALSRLRGGDKEFLNEDGTFSHVGKMPTFHEEDPGKSCVKYLEEFLQQPAYADAIDFQGVVEIEFVIYSEGKVRAPRVITHSLEDLNLEAMRVLVESSGWQPGFQKKIPVNVSLNCQFEFKDPDVIERYYIVEEMPKFLGMDPPDGFRKFIASNLRYPEEAAESNITGRVIIQFTVMSDGNVEEIQIVRSVHPKLDEEAIRVVSNSPRWTPDPKRQTSSSGLYLSGQFYN